MFDGSCNKITADLQVARQSSYMSVVFHQTPQERTWRRGRPERWGSARPSCAVSAVSMIRRVLVIRASFRERRPRNEPCRLHPDPAVMDNKLEKDFQSKVCRRLRGLKKFYLWNEFNFCIFDFKQVNIYRQLPGRGNDFVLTEGYSWWTFCRWIVWRRTACSLDCGRPVERPRIRRECHLRCCIRTDGSENKFVINSKLKIYFISYLTAVTGWRLHLHLEIADNRTSFSRVSCLTPTCPLPQMPGMLSKFSAIADALTLLPNCRPSNWRRGHHRRPITHSRGHTAQPISTEDAIDITNQWRTADQRDDKLNDEEDEDETKWYFDYF